MRSLALEPPLSHLSVGCSSTIWIQKRMLSVNVPENLRVTPSFIQINVLRVLTHYTGVENSDEGNIWQRLQKYELYTTWDGWVCRKSSISLPVHYQCSYSYWGEKESRESRFSRKNLALLSREFCVCVFFPSKIWQWKSLLGFFKCISILILIFKI